MPISNQETENEMGLEQEQMKSKLKKKPIETDKRLLGNTPGIGALRKDPTTGHTLAPLPVDKFKLRYEQIPDGSDCSSAR